jgi:type IV pilus assembly protein PilM
MMDVLLVASRKENVEDRVAALEFCGLKAGIVDVESYAIENVFNLIMDPETERDVDRTVAVVDVGASLMALNVIKNGHSLYIREQAFGGKELTAEIQRKYGLSFAEAGIAKKLGGLPESYAAEVLEPFKQAMTQQINVSLQFFRSSSASSTIDSLVLAGGCASIRGIREYVESSLDIPTVIADPFSRMIVANRIKLQTLRAEAPSFMVACGLALRSFD